MAEVSQWRLRSRELMASAPFRSPRPAAFAAARSWSVTLAMALTTTTGRLTPGQPACDNFGSAVDRRSIFDRSAAKLHHHRFHTETAT